MKIIAYDREYGCGEDVLKQALECDDTAGVHPPFGATVLTDSAALRSHEPMFVPDFAGDWVVEIAPAVIISRLGKWIAPRFAPRYYSRMMMVGRLLPGAGEIPASALHTNFDGALARGIEFDASAVAGNGLDITVNGEKTLHLDAGRLFADDMIALTSRYMMLKTGDVIVPCRTPLRVKATPDTRVKVEVNGMECMALKIK